MIIFDKVSKKFFNDTFGVEGVSFAIEPKELVLITGPTGSGKTTLMRLMTKEYEPEEGEIFFNEVPLSQVKPSLLAHHRQRIGVIFQDYRLLPESNVWENIALPLMIAGKKQTTIEERVTDLLKLVDLTNKADLFPQELSGGEAQRVSIARALATAPPVIFADEPTGNLDKNTSHAIVRLLKKINELGTTVLLATHDVVVLEELNKVRRLELKNGQLVTDTKPKEIKVSDVKEKQDKQAKNDKSHDKKHEKKTKPVAKTKSKPSFKWPFRLRSKKDNNQEEASA